MLTLAVTEGEKHPRGGYPDNQESLGSIQMQSSFWTCRWSAKFTYLLRPPSKIQQVDCLEDIIEHLCTSAHHHFISLFRFSGMKACFAFLFLLATTFALSVSWNIFTFFIFPFKTFNICHSFLSMHRWRANLMENIIGCTRILILPRKRYDWTGWTQIHILNKWFHVLH